MEGNLILSGDAVVGAQKPPLSLYPPLYATPLADEAVALARVAGIRLMPWQEDLLRQSLGVREDMLFSSRRICLIVPRQNGKNILVEARELAGLLLLGEKNIIHTAQLFGTCKDAFDQLDKRILNSPLKQEFLDSKSGNQEVCIRAINGGRITYKARSKDSIRGLREVDLLIADEAYDLSQDEMGAALPAQAAAKNPQLWMTSSSGFDTSVVLRDVRESGLRGDGDRLLFAEWSAPEGSDVAREDVIASVNPSYGFHLDREKITAEYQTLDYEQFARDRCGMWEFFAEDEAIPAAEWADTVDVESRSVGRVAFVADITPDRRWGCVYAVTHNQYGLYHVEAVQATGLVRRAGETPAEGTGWMPEYLQRLLENTKDSVLGLIPGGAAGGLIPRLSELGVEYTPLSAPQVAQGASAFLDAVMQHQLKRPQDSLLDEAVAGAIRVTGKNDGFFYGRRDPVINISPLIAASCGLFLFGTMEVKPEPIRKVWGF